MKTILVTGSNGFVGKHLIDELSGNGFEVIGVDRTQGGSIASGFMSVDLTKPSEVNKIDFRNISIVIHLAGLAAVGPSFDEPMRYIETNVGIEANLFEAAMKQDVRPKFLIISSGSLYDPSGKMPLREDSPILASSPYAVSKLGQEQLAMYYQARGFECVIARPFNHIGPGQGLGFLLPDLAKQITEVEKGLSSKVLVGNLDSKRDYTDVRDIVRAYRMLIETGQPGAVYNICSGVAVSGRKILSILQGQSDIKFSIEIDPAKSRPSDSPVLFGDNSKIHRDTGWKPEIKLEQTLSDVMTDWRKRV